MKLTLPRTRRQSQPDESTHVVTVKSTYGHPQPSLKAQSGPACQVFSREHDLEGNTHDTTYHELHDLRSSVLLR